MKQRSLCIAILGPTACGKTSLALQLAPKVNGELICMDSTTVYKGFDIGTAKPTKEEQEKVPHHLLDVIEPNEPFSAGHFVDLAESKIEDVLSRGKTPIVVGGTYFYMRALQHGMYPVPIIAEETIESIEKEFFEDDALQTGRMHDELKAKDPKSARSIHPNDRYRLVRALAVLRTTKQKPSELKPVTRTPAQNARLWMKYGVTISRHALNQAIIRRTEEMITGGLIDETKKLRGFYPEARALQSIGYNEVCGFLDRKLTEKQLRNEIIEKTRQLAKRQVTWLRSDAEIRYVDFRDLDRIQLEYDNLKFALE